MSKEVNGYGIFSWDGTERRTDRYGSFTLDRIGYDGNGSYPEARFENINPLRGKNVKIVAEILVSRESGHIGDLSRGIYPSRPNVGETVELGIGTLYIEPCTWSQIGFQVALFPDDGRIKDWLDPVKLYRLHDQTVKITITETEEVAVSAPRDGGTESTDLDLTMIVTQDKQNRGIIQVKSNNWGLIVS